MPGLRRRLQDRLAGRRRDERGASAIFVGLSLTVLVASLGMSVDLGNVAYQRNAAQDLADSAVRHLATVCAKDPTSSACTSAQSTASAMVTQDSKFVSSNVTASSTPSQYKATVNVDKDVTTSLLGVLGISSKHISATATARWHNGSPTAGYPVLPLGVSYCTWKNNSGFAGTSTEASHRTAIRTDTLQSVTTLLNPVTSGVTGSLVPLTNLLSNLTGSNVTDSCTATDGTQLLTFKGGIWLTGENVLSSTLSGLFNMPTGTCTLNVANGTSTFLGGLESAAFVPTACLSKFGPGKPVDVGQTILLPIYKPADPQGLLWSGVSKLGLKLSTCASLLGSSQTCVNVVPQIGVQVVGYAPFTITGYTYPGTPSPTDTSVGCAPIPLSFDLKSVLVNLVGLVQVVLNLTSTLLNLLGVPLTASVACNGLQGYFTKSVVKDPNFTWSTTGPDEFGADYVQLTN